ncbi:hypothetical protein IPH19_02270 [Candidatus Uhrbacteria bacterium]|nr:MAG: hypothetical protein IPH19_02270 [Candidatus Uhrbacteria bacterium]
MAELAARLPLSSESGVMDEEHHRVHVTYKLPSPEVLKSRFENFHIVEVRRTFHRSCVNLHQRPRELTFCLAKIPSRFQRQTLWTNLDDLAVYYGSLGYRFAIDLEGVDFARAVRLPSDNQAYVVGTLRAFGRVEAMSICYALSSRTDQMSIGSSYIDIGDCRSSMMRILLVRQPF